MRYQKIKNDVWDDPQFSSLTSFAKLLLFYLETSPRSNSIGLYRIKRQYMEADLNWDSDLLSKHLNELIEKNFIAYDYNENLVLIKNHMKENGIDNENQAKSAISIIESFPNSNIFDEFLDSVKKFASKYYEFIKNGCLDKVNDAFETVSEPFRNPSETLSKPETETETETKSRTETEPPPTPPRGERVFLKKSFEKFWQAYPKKKSKGDAQKAWKALKPNEQLQDTILDALERAKTSASWAKDSGQYVPYPATWIRAMGWEDEEEVGVVAKSESDLWLEKKLAEQKTHKPPDGGVNA